MASISVILIGTLDDELTGGVAKKEKRKEEAGSAEEAKRKRIFLFDQHTTSNMFQTLLYFVGLFAISSHKHHFQG